MPALAQPLPSSNTGGKRGEITAKPICSKLTNRSDQTIMGTLSTAPQRIESGDMVRHQDNFKLIAGASKEFCASGPFYEGQRLELTLRTLIPLFSCKTKINREILLYAEEDLDGVKRLSADCY